MNEVLIPRLIDSLIRDAIDLGSSNHSRGMWNPTKTRMKAVRSSAKALLAEALGRKPTTGARRLPLTTKAP